jgi:hypothetical protein
MPADKNNKALKKGMVEQIETKLICNYRGQQLTNIKT